MGIMHWWKGFSAGTGNTATIDVVKAAPPPSPLAPVDLTDPTEVAAVMDVAARIGDVLLSSGTSNRDTVAQVHAVTSAYGLHYAHVDITLNTITVFTNIGVEKMVPVSVFRVVGHMTTDFSKLSAVDKLIRSIQAGATPVERADAMLRSLYLTPPTYSHLTTLAGWGGLGAAVSVMLGGGMLAAVASFCIAVTIMATCWLLQRNKLAPFFQNAIGGFIATVPAAFTYSMAQLWGITIIPSHIIASGLVVLLAGLTLVQSLQDGITGAPVTASARFFETLLLTGAIIAGVGAGIRASVVLGITLPPLDTFVDLSFGSAAVKIAAGVAASISYAVACQARNSAVFATALTAALGASVYYLIIPLTGFTTIFATSITATLLGLIGGLIARRYLIPPLITAIAGITPLLPGLAIYRGMYAALHEQILVGFSNMALALSLAAALASGVVLGEWIARKLRRPPSLHLYRYFRSQKPAHAPNPPPTSHFLPPRLEN
ncbi:threonine/serine exporter ThrE [Corynebacterium sp. HS2168-gen11]|uniref:threonine/serine exporter ThrE n=1 Tax=Corynebacterium sp. HS2168-gen11 TaxID=2974027 RepID=UPI00216B5F4A|nr:threonine/serine exporter family protein [Corynebacterium sp. HS2168-gen11]MCS4536079.1 threonine/serine exporter family protein [Corynebacterium sp. HS2168-gen11]